MPALAFDFLCSVFKKHHCGAHTTRYRAGGAVLPSPETTTRGHSIRTLQLARNRVLERLHRLAGRVDGVKRQSRPAQPVKQTLMLPAIGGRAARCLLIPVGYLAILCDLRPL